MKQLVEDWQWTICAFKKIDWQNFMPHIEKSFLDEIIVSLLIGSYGIKGIVCDIDNTTYSHNTTSITSMNRLWLQGITKTGLQYAFATHNNRSTLLDRIQNDIQWPIIKGYEINPLKGFFDQIIKEMNLKAEEIVLVNDSLIILAFAQYYGFKTCYVHPIVLNSEHDTIILPITRRIERFLLPHFFQPTL